MKNVIVSIERVSDGIIISFEGGLNCYYSTAFLVEHASTGSNTVFLSFDPTELAELHLKHQPLGTGAAVLISSD